MIAAVMIALLRTTKTFNYTFNSTSISLQTYNLSVIDSAVIQNRIQGQNRSVILPLSTVTGYGQGETVWKERLRETVSVALSSVNSTSVLSFYDQSM